MERQRKREYLKLEALECVRSAARSNDESSKAELLKTGVEKYRQYLDFPENKDDDDAWAGMGGAYRRLNDIDKAIESYQSAYNLNGSSTYALVNLATLLAARQRPGDKELLAHYSAKAQQLFQQIIDKGKADYWNLFDVATLQMIDGRVEESQASFKYAAERTPKDKVESFRSVLSNLQFLKTHQPAMPGLLAAIKVVEGYLVKPNE